MTPALRKRHQRTWWFLGLALLFIWGTSMAVINKNKVSDYVPETVDEATGFSIAINKGDNDNAKKISIDVSGTVSSPQTLVYLAPSKNTTIENSQLLGSINEKGKYFFQLDSISSAMPIKVIRGYDNIHKKEIFSTIIKKK